MMLGPILLMGVLNSTVSSTIVPGSLPCLNSQPPCLNQLTEAAIVHSPEIESLDERLELMGKHMNRQYERRWTAILEPLGDLLSLNPFRLVGAVFGGGSFRDGDLKIADLEVKVSDLVRRRAEVTVQLHDQVTDLVFAVEKADRQLALFQTQLTSQHQRVAVLEAHYRTGGGNTAQMISLWQQTENLEAHIVEAEVTRSQALRKLLEITGYEASNELVSPRGDCRHHHHDETLGVFQ